MSLLPPSDDPSPPSERGPRAGGEDPEPPSAELVRKLGAPLIEALERHLPGSADHAEATGTYAYAAAAELGRRRPAAELARESAKLHEIGAIYDTAGPAAGPTSSSEEGARAESQHEAGYRLARSAGIPEPVCETILRVRERYDGRGPEGLAGEAIPINARIARTACACHRALTDPSLGPAPAPAARRAHAIDELRSQAGRRLDPRVVEALCAVLARAGRR